MTSSGKVFIVGSGPGDIGYLTLKGQQALRQAEVLVYDALVDENFLQWVSTACLKLDVGKRGGKPSTPQTEINQLLVQHCLEGRQVVRLKSGDPFIFGRCTAEIEALKQAYCAYEVVPGLSSALAAPLLASIPLTDPVLSRCFAVFSAHDPEALNWQALAPLDTLVILMGGRALPEIIHQLEKHGRSLQTPIAVIRWAGHPQQQIWTGTLESIIQKTARQPLSPTVMVIGEVVRLRPFLQPTAPPEVQSKGWADDCITAMTDSLPPPSHQSQLPLTGKTVLVTRSAGQSSQFTELLQQQGAAVLEVPALEITPPSSWAELDEAIAHLSRFDWLILTSANGVNYFFERLAHHGQDARALATLKIAVVGKKTAASLAQQGIKPDFIPPDFVADSLVENFPEGDRLNELNMLFPRVETGGREVLVQALTAQGATVTEVAAYQSGCPDAIAPDALEALQHDKIDIITFASSKTVRCFHQMLAASCAPVEGQNSHPDSSPEFFNALPIASRVCIASIGPQTSRTCQELFERVDIEAQEFTLEGLTQALVQWASHSISAS